MAVGIGQARTGNLALRKEDESHETIAQHLRKKLVIPSPQCSLDHGGERR